MALSDMLATVQLSDEDAQKLADSCAAKARALREARQMLAARFGDKSRVGTAEVLTWLDEDAAEYDKGTDPRYWQAEREVPAPEPAPRRARKPRTPQPEAQPES